MLQKFDYYACTYTYLLKLIERVIFEEMHQIKVCYHLFINFKYDDF